MATISIKVLKNQRKNNGTYNVKIQIEHRKNACFIKNSSFRFRRIVTPRFKYKRSGYLQSFKQSIVKILGAIGKIGNVLNYYSAGDIKDYLLGLGSSPHLISFSRGYINDLEKVNVPRSAQNYYISSALSLR